MASDYIQAKASRDLQKQLGESEFPFKKVKNMVEATVDDMKGELRALTDKIMKVERKAAPEYVANRNTRQLHKALSSYADAGPESAPICGFAFAKPGTFTSCESTVPAYTTWKKVCSTCLPALRASLKGY